MAYIKSLLNQYNRSESYKSVNESISSDISGAQDELTDLNKSVLLFIKYYSEGLDISEDDFDLIADIISKKFDLGKMKYYGMARSESLSMGNDALVMVISDDHEDIAIVYLEFDGFGYKLSDLRVEVNNEEIGRMKDLSSRDLDKIESIISKWLRLYRIGNEILFKNMDDSIVSSIGRLREKARNISFDLRNPNNSQVTSIIRRDSRKYGKTII